MQYFNDSDGLSISNVVVTPGSVLAEGTFNLSFKLSLKSNATGGTVSGDIDIGLGDGVIYENELDFPHGWTSLKLIRNQSIAKGKSKTYTTTITLSDLTTLNTEPGGYLSSEIHVSNSSGGYYMVGVYQIILYLDQRTAPEIISYTLTDRAPMRNVSDGSPLEYFGNVLQTASLPRLTYNFALDPLISNDPTLTANHQLEYTIGGVTTTLTTSTVHGITSVAFNLNAIQQAGTVSWKYIITDSYGNTDTETGSFNVIAYSPPAITNLLLERYAVVPDAGGEAHEASDDGTHLWLTLAAGIAAVNSRNAWTAVMTYWDAALGESTAVTVTSQDGWTLGGTDGTVISLSRDETQLAGIVADDTKSYSFRLTITDALNNSVTQVFDGIVKAGAVLDVSPGGVGVGKRCTGTEGGGELFQCAYPAYFDGDASFGGNVAVGSGKLLKVVNVTVASSLSIAGGSSADCTATVNPGTGWTPICTTGTRCNNGRIIMRRVYLSGTTVHVEPVNTGTSTYTIGIQADVLCIRTSL